ncbi:Profilin [Rhynchospora pubera]|uniref:Profilin n=1 Tax=Rhynchospora pubera TaxID=906938 RepID=A0AAV8GU49_9POAL|nr:Profilin [Rhynchospora pubera]
MSWENYVQWSLIDPGLTSAAIVGHDGNLFAASQSFSYDKEEIQAILPGLEDPDTLMGKSISLGGTQYSIIKSDRAMVIGAAGSKGVCITKTTQAFIIGICDKPVGVGKCSAIVEKLANHLIEMGL